MVKDGRLKKAGFLWKSLPLMDGKSVNRARLQVSRSFMKPSLTCIAEAWADRYKNNTGIASIGDAGVVFVMVGK